MMSLQKLRCVSWRLFSTSVRCAAEKVHGGSDGTECGPGGDLPAEWQSERHHQPPIPEYVDRQGESMTVLRARLLYQSRKRGTLENGLLLSTFAARYLTTFNPEQLLVYDRLINKPSNDWDIYYWIIGHKPTPVEYDTDVMNLLKEHAKNKTNEMRITLPELNS